MHRNASERKQEQFHQGQYAVVRGRGTEVYQIHKFPGNLKKYLPKKADCMVSYKYNSFQVDMVNCYWISQFYHKPVRSCSFLAKKKVRFYAGLGVLQTPNNSDKKRCLQTKATSMSPNPVLKLFTPVLQYILLLFRFKKHAYKLMLAECLIDTVFHTHLYDSLSTQSAYIYIPSITSKTA